MTPYRFVTHHVGVPMSDLISKLAAIAGSEIHAGFAPAGRDVESLASKAADLSAPILDYAAAARAAGWTTADMTPGMFVSNSLVDDESGLAVTHEGDWESLCDEFGYDPYNLDVHQHWAVSDELARKLAANGQRVDIDFAGIAVWARTSSGEFIWNDDVIQKIASEA